MRDKLETELKKVIPTFIKRNKVNDYMKRVKKEMKELSKEYFRGIKPSDDKVSLVTEVPYLDMVVASSVFPFTNISLPQIVSHLSKIPEEKKNYIFNKYTGDRKNRRDR